VWNNKDAAVAAVHSVDLDRWQEAFSEVIDRIAPRFARYEPLRHAAGLLQGLVSGLDRKNCWTIAEHRGSATPDGLQHLLGRAKWDADAVRDDLRGYVIDHWATPRRSWSSTRPVTSRRASTRWRYNASTPAPPGGSRTPRSRCT